MEKTDKMKSLLLQCGFHQSSGIVTRNIFYILLTVRLDVILVNNQLDALFLSVFISRLYMFQTTSSHHQEEQPVSIHHTDGVLIKDGLPDDEHLLLETCTGMK